MRFAPWAPAKPVIFTPMNEGAPIAPAHVEEAAHAGRRLASVSRARFARLGRLATLAGGRTQARGASTLPAPFHDRPSTPVSSLSIRSKEILAAFGIPTPSGAHWRERSRKRSALRRRLVSRRAQGSVG